MCPKPPPGTGPDSGNASSLPESDQPGPSTAIPHSPTVEGHETAEDTYSEVQDEEDGFVSSRRKRRPRSELILAYQCTVCGKRYASGPALSLHKKNTHKQPAVPCDEHGDATKADNSSGATKASNSSVDDGSQGPSKCRRRKKSEIDRPFSCSVWHKVRRTLDSQQDQAWFMTNEPYCEMHAFYVV